MSSTLVESAVSSDQGALTFSRTIQGVSAVQDIFLVPVGNPARIESVFARMDTDTDVLDTESLVLFMQQANGDIMWVGQSPVILGQDATFSYVSWARGNQDSSQFAAYKADAIEGSNPNFVNPPLPDFVLPANSFLSMAYNCGTGGNTGILTVSGILVTYTVGTGPTSQTAVGQGIPLLTATDSG